VQLGVPLRIWSNLVAKYTFHMLPHGRQCTPEPEQRTLHNRLYHPVRVPSGAILLDANIAKP